MLRAVWQDCDAYGLGYLCCHRAGTLLGRSFCLYHSVVTATGCLLRWARVEKVGPLRMGWPVPKDPVVGNRTHRTGSSVGTNGMLIGPYTTGRKRGRDLGDSVEVTSGYPGSSSAGFQCSAVQCPLSGLQALHSPRLQRLTYLRYLLYNIEPGLSAWHVHYFRCFCIPESHHPSSPFPCPALPCHSPAPAPLPLPPWTLDPGPLRNIHFGLVTTNCSLTLSRSALTQPNPTHSLHSTPNNYYNLEMSAQAILCSDPIAAILRSIYIHIHIQSVHIKVLPPQSIPGADQHQHQHTSFLLI